MTDEKAPPEKSAESQSSRASGGRLLAGLGLIFGLAGLAAAAYLYYTLVFLDPVAGVNGRMGELAAEQKQLRAELRRLNGEQQTALEHLRNEQEKGRQQAEELLAQKFQNLASPEPVSVQAWKTAEVEYLLRVANQRVLMERDVKGALGLLKSADGLLSELDDYAMHDVRAALAEEILRLEQFVSADVSGIFLRLEAVKRQLGRQVGAFALSVPEFALGEPASAADTAGGPGEASGFFNVLATELGKLVRIRRIDTGFKPPLAPTEATYLELNLRLMLEQAQLAALKYDQAVYGSSLDSALEWIHAYLDTQDSRVQEAMGTLQTLRTLDLASAPPDISASLNELVQARQAAE